MSDTEKKSHWQFLANLLGAKPKESDFSPPPAKQEAANAPSGPQVVSALQTPAAKKKTDHPEPRPMGNKKRHWGDVARSLGMATPEPPEPEEEIMEPAPLPIAEKLTGRALVDPRESSVSPKVSESYEDVEIEDTSVDVIEPEDQGDETETGVRDREERGRSRGRSRRRGGRRRRRRGPAETAAEAQDTREDDVRPAVSRDVVVPNDDRDEVEFPLDDRDTIDDDDEPQRDRRRRRRRRGRVESEDDRPAPKERPTRRAIRDEEEVVHSHTRREPIVDEDDDDDDDDEDSGADRSVPRRAVPSWQEAIESIISQNLANRQRSRERDPHRDRGRGRGGRRGDNRRRS